MAMSRQGPEPRNLLPLIGHGIWPLAGDESMRCVAMVLETGDRQPDTAQTYGKEAEAGRAVAASGLPRHDIFIFTKVGPSNLSPGRFRDSVRLSADDFGGLPDRDVAAASNTSKLAFTLSEDDMAAVGTPGRQGRRLVEPASTQGRGD